MVGRQIRVLNPGRGSLDTIEFQANVNHSLRLKNKMKQKNWGTEISKTTKIGQMWQILVTPV